MCWGRWAVSFGREAGVVNAKWKGSEQGSSVCVWPRHDGSRANLGEGDPTTTTTTTHTHTEKEREREREK